MIKKKPELAGGFYAAGRKRCASPEAQMISQDLKRSHLRYMLHLQSGANDKIVFTERLNLPHGCASSEAQMIREMSRTFPGLIRCCTAAFAVVEMIS